MNEEERKGKKDVRTDLDTDSATSSNIGAVSSPTIHCLSGLVSETTSGLASLGTIIATHRETNSRTSSNIREQAASTSVLQEDRREDT